jgi:drug/metabolite transporter (DMT)-like permease
MTVIMQGFSALSVALFIPFFGWKLPASWWPVLLLITASIFFGISDRINTTVRSGIEASTYSIIRQLTTVFMIIAGFLFFREPFIIRQALGATLIVISNIIIFWRPHQKINKYFLMGVGSNLLLAVALFIDVNISEQFNLPFYLMVSLATSVPVVMIVSRVGPKKVIKEWKANKRIRYMLIVGASGGGLMLTGLLAYQTGQVSIVAPLLALTVLANVIVGYIFLRERDYMPRKILAACLIIIGIILLRIV